MTRRTIQTTIGSVTTKLGSGATPRGGSTVYQSSGTALIRSQNVYDNQFAFRGLAFIDDDAAFALRNVTVESGDVLLNITGDSVARCCLVPESVLPARVNQHVMIVRPDKLQLDSRYLQLWLVDPSTKQQLLALASAGATRPALTKDHVASLVINVPSMSEQRTVSSVFNVLDDQIEKNQREIQNCFELSVALYRQSLEAGTTFEKVDSIATFRNRQRIPLSSRERALRKGAYPYYGAAGVLDYVDDFLFDGVHVLVGEDGTVLTDDRHPMIQYAWGKFWVSNHAHVLNGISISNELLRCALSEADVSSAVTGAVQPKLSMGNLKAVGLEIPEHREDLEDLLGAIGALERALSTESACLWALRETLLHPLISDELRVRDTSLRVEEAV